MTIPHPSWAPSPAELERYGEDVTIVIRRHAATKGWPVFILFPMVARVERGVRWFWRGVLETWGIVRWGR